MSIRCVTSYLATAFILSALISPHSINATLILRAKEAVRQHANQVFTSFISLFNYCLTSSMSNQRFITDNIHNLINYPSKTTVGFAPNFTNNRKFLANMLSSAAFKEMLANDEEELRLDFIKKLEYCDKAIMEQDILKDFYDREVDLSKI